MKESEFEIGDLVVGHLRKGRFPNYESNKLKLNKIRPHNVLTNFWKNSYEIDLPLDIVISPTFNFSDFYPYRKL